MDSHDDVLAELGEEVQRDRPRMFAIYGVYNEQLAKGEYPGYIEWGLEFPEQSRAIAWSPGSTSVSDSAEQMLETNTKLGAARLVWFL